MNDPTSEGLGTTLVALSVGASCLLAFGVLILPLSFLGTLLGGVLDRESGSNYSIGISIGLRSAFVAACILATLFAFIQSNRLRRKSPFEIKHYALTSGIASFAVFGGVAVFWLENCFY